jgi:hypothetical protein
MELLPIHFHDQPIEPVFDSPPFSGKDVPIVRMDLSGRERTYHVTEMLSSWT